jgi:hypothetical protein
LDFANLDDHPNLASDLLLGSDLQVPWQRKLVGLWGSIDYAQIDIANDGRSMAVYRWGRWTEVLSDNELYIVSKPVEAWSGQDHFPDDFPREALEKQSELHLYVYNREPYRTITRSFLFNAAKLRGTGLNLNVLSVQGRSVLIVSGAAEGREGLNSGYPFYVFAFLYHNNGAPSLVCKFHFGA